MAQISRPIHELTGALTQGHRGSSLLRPQDPLGEGSLTQLVAASINCQPERVDKRAPLFRAGGLFFYASEATALVAVASPLQGQSSNGALLS